MLTKHRVLIGCIDQFGIRSACNQSTKAKLIMFRRPFHYEGSTLEILATQPLTDVIRPRTIVHEIVSGVLILWIFRELLSATDFVTTSGKTVKGTLTYHQEHEDEDDGVTPNLR